MASLKTNYKDDIFEGSRKYRIVNNADGTVSFSDETEYLQEGDTYGASDINEQNEVINSKGVVVSDTVIDVADRQVGNLYFFYS